MIVVKLVEDKSSTDTGTLARRRYVWYSRIANEIEYVIEEQLEK